MATPNQPAILPIVIDSIMNSPSGGCCVKNIGTRTTLDFEQAKDGSAIVSSANRKFHIIPLSSDLTCIIRDVHTGRVPDLIGGNPRDGTRIIGWQLYGVASWKPDSTWRATMAAVWKNFGVTLPETFVQQQLWALEFVEGNLEYPLNYWQLQLRKPRRIRNVLSGTYLDVDGGATAGTGAKVHGWKRHDTVLSQIWEFSDEARAVDMRGGQQAAR